MTVPGKCGWPGDKGQRSKVKGLKSEVRSQRAKVRGQRAEVRGQRSAGIYLTAKNAETAKKIEKTDETTDQDTPTAGPERNRFLSCFCVLRVLCGSNPGGQR